MNGLNLRRFGSVGLFFVVGYGVLLTKSVEADVHGSVYDLSPDDDLEAILNDTISFSAKLSFTVDQNDTTYYTVRREIFYIDPDDIEVVVQPTLENVNVTGGASGSPWTGSITDKVLNKVGQWTFGGRVMIQIQGQSEWTEIEQTHIHVTVTQSGGGG